MVLWKIHYNFTKFEFRTFNPVNALIRKSISPQSILPRSISLALCWLAVSDKLFLNFQTIILYDWEFFATFKKNNWQFFYNWALTFCGCLLSFFERILDLKQIIIFQRYREYRSSIKLLGKMKTQVCDKFQISSKKSEVDTFLMTRKSSPAFREISRPRA